MTEYNSVRAWIAKEHCRHGIHSCWGAQNERTEDDDTIPLVHPTSYSCDEKDVSALGVGVDGPITKTHLR